MFYYGAGCAEWMITILDGGHRIIEQTTANTRLPTYEEVTFDTTSLAVTSRSGNLGGPNMRNSWSSTGTSTHQKTSAQNCTVMAPVSCATPSVDYTPAPGTKRVITMDPYLLPFVITQSGERDFTAGPANVVRVDTCNSVAPANHVRDSCVAVTWSESNPQLPHREELWFDRATFIVDRYLLGTQPAIDRFPDASDEGCRLKF